MTYKEAVDRLTSLRERLAESAAHLISGEPAISAEREKDSTALGVLMGAKARDDDPGTCPTCGV